MIKRSLAILGGVCLLVVFALNVVIHYNVLTKPFPGHNDYLSRWEGARSFFIDGLSPYSDQASLNIQYRIYGRSAIDNEDPGLFVYPFHMALLIWPLVYVDYAWAAAIWMVLLEALLIAATVLLLDLYKWRPEPLMFGMLVLWSLVDYFALRGLVLGQPSHVVYFLQVLTLWLLYKQRDAAAGVALAMSTIKPQMGYLIVPFLLLWGLRYAHFRFVVWFGVSFAVLMGVSFMLEPSWFGDWIEQVRLYPEYTLAAYPDTGSPVWIVIQYYLGLGNAAEWLINWVFIMPMLWAWYSVLVQRRQPYFLWAMALTLVVSHLVALRTATPHFVVFNLVLFFYLARINRKHGGFAAIGLLLLVVVFIWGQFLITVQGRNTFEHPVMFLVMPFAMFALLIVTRKLWWAEAPQLKAITA